MLRYSNQKQTQKSQAVKKPMKHKLVLPNNRVSSIDKVFGDKTDYSACGLTTVSNIEIPPETKHLVLDDNPFRALDNFPNLPSLLTLSIANTGFETFRGFPVFESLTEIDIRGTPECKVPNYKSALLILIPTLKKINGDIVTSNERRLADSFNSRTPVLLRNGWQPSFRPPTEEETDRILTRLIAMNKNKYGSRPTSKANASHAYATTVSEKYERMIREREEEIERLQRLIQERMRTVNSPLKRPKCPPVHEKDLNPPVEEKQPEPETQSSSSPSKTKRKKSPKRRNRSPRKSETDTLTSETLTYETGEGETEEAKTNDSEQLQQTSEQQQQQNDETNNNQDEQQQNDTTQESILEETPAENTSQTASPSPAKKGKKGKGKKKKTPKKQ